MEGPVVVMFSTPCLGPGFSLHLGPSSSLRRATLTVEGCVAQGATPGGLEPSAAPWNRGTEA